MNYDTIRDQEIQVFKNVSLLQMNNKTGIQKIETKVNSKMLQK